MISAALITVGYVALIAMFGWRGGLAAIAHLVILLVASARSGPAAPAARNEGDARHRPRSSAYAEGSGTAKATVRRSMARL